MKKKNFFFILIIFLVFLFYLIIDFSLSKIFLKNNHCYNFQYFPKGYFYDLKKNCISKFRFKSGYPSVDLVTDSRGLRTNKEKKIIENSKENIFLFGDSFTFGVGLNYADTFAGIFEKTFPEYNFLNFAVGSYSPTVHLYRLKKILNNNIFPKKIFIFLDLTDVIDESQRWSFDKKINLPIRPDQGFGPKDNFFNQNFRLSYEIVNLVRYNMRILKRKSKDLSDNSQIIKSSIQGQFTYTPKNKLDKRFWDNNKFQKGIDGIEYNINEIIKISKKINSELYIVTYPWAETLQYGQNEFNWSKFARDLCENNKCKAIDAIPKFESYKNKEKNWLSELYLIRDVHFNKGGAKLLAEVLIKSF